MLIFLTCITEVEKRSHCSTLVLLLLFHVMIIYRHASIPVCSDRVSSISSTSSHSRCRIRISPHVCIRPISNGPKLTAIIPDTATAALASANVGDKLGMMQAMPAAINTAILRNVSAITCCVHEPNNVKCTHERGEGVEINS